MTLGTRTICQLYVSIAWMTLEGFSQVNLEQKVANGRKKRKQPIFFTLPATDVLASGSASAASGTAPASGSTSTWTIFSTRWTLYNL
jgi:hypothetical protein